MHGNNAQLQFKQKDKVYIDFVYNIFKPFGIVGAAPKEQRSIIKPSGNTRISYQFATFTLPFFTDLYNQWYVQRNGKNIKIVPNNIDELLTDLALAYWISGDGCYCKSQGCIKLATNSFLHSEVKLLQSALSKNFDINSTINIANKEKEQYIIRIPKQEVIKVQALVQPFMPTSMLYRIGLDNNAESPGFADSPCS